MSLTAIDLKAWAVDTTAETWDPQFDAFTNRRFVWLVTDEATEQYGTGPTTDAALDDLRGSLRDYRRILRQDEGRLSPRLTEHLSQLHDLPEGGR